MSLKRSAKESTTSTIQPLPKRRRLNSTLSTNSLSLNNNNPCTSSYHDYSNKFKKSSHNLNNIQKDNFVRSLTKINYLYGHKGCVNTLCWEKSGRHLCTGSDDQTVRLWDVFGIKYNGKTPKMLCILKGHLSNVFTAKFMYNSSVFGINNMVTSGGNDADINIYDINHSPYTFKPYMKNNHNHNTTTLNSLFVKPLYTYSHHSRKILKISVHTQKPFEIFSCSADGTIRHFDIRQKYKKKKFMNSSQDIIIQGFGGGPRTNRGRFSESLLYDFNTFNKHYEVYSIDINPIKPWEILTSCGDGYIRIFDLRIGKHCNINGKYNKCCDINSLYKYNKNNAISCFYNFRIKFPQHCHPTDAKYNSDGSEILSTHIRDACYLYINPTTIDAINTHDHTSQSNMNQKTDEINDDTANIIKFIEEEEEDNYNINMNETNVLSSNDENTETENELDSDYGEFVDMLNFAVISRMAARERQQMFVNAEYNTNNNNNQNDMTQTALWNDSESENENENNETYDTNTMNTMHSTTSHTMAFRVDNEILDHVEALVDRRKEVLRSNCSEYDFQNILFDLVSKQESKLIELDNNNENKNTDKCVCSVNDDDLIKCMKWIGDIKNKNKNKCENIDMKQKRNMLPPMNSNMDIINCYNNEYYKLSYKPYVDDKKEDDKKEDDVINGMKIGEEIELHDLNKKVHYFGKYVGHIHCETIKEVAFFSDNYIITGSDDKKIYIYDRLNGDIVNILINGTNIVNNIATHPYLPIFVSSGLDSHVTLWGPNGWNNNDNDMNDDIDYKQHELNCTQQVVDNVVRLRHRAGYDVL